jgi:hypothetical protein
MSVSIVGRPLGNFFIEAVLLTFLLVPGSYACVRLFLAALRLPSGLSAILMLPFSPLSAYYLVAIITLIIGALDKRRPPEYWSMDRFRWLVLLILSIGLSFSLTFAALFVGHHVNPHAWVPQTGQMIASNVVFDGLTVVVTLLVLENSVGSQVVFPIPAAIFLDLILGALFACASLGLGLAFTDRQLSFLSLGWTLIGHSQDGSHWEFGPYFWAMHTTFLPTLVYLALVLVCWAGKCFLVVIKWFLGKGKLEEINPLGMTSALAALLAAVFAAAAYFLPG